jgi:Protein of unknown function (DUF1460)
MSSDSNVRSRLIQASAYFLGSSFDLNPIGEGADGIDQEPTVVATHFDCTTFVETALALAFAKSLPTFQQQLFRLRYGMSAVAFENRLHFPYSQWVLTNERQGFFRVVRTPPMRSRRSRVDVEKWLRFLPQNQMYGNVDFSSKEAIESIERILQTLGRQYSFDIASGSVQSLVRVRAFQSSDIIGFTSLGGTLAGYPGEGKSIAHMGIVVAVEPEVIVRAASRRVGKVIDLPLRGIGIDRALQGVEAVLLRLGNEDVQRK